MTGPAGHPQDSARLRVDHLRRDTRLFAEVRDIHHEHRRDIDNLPDRAIVEVPALVGSRGIRGLHVGPLPELVAELCRREIAVAGLAVEAAVTGNRQTALQSLLLDPCLDDMDTAQAILDAYLAEYADYLPQFQPSG